MTNSEGTVTISLERFRSLEQAEKLLQASLSDPDKFVCCITWVSDYNERVSSHLFPPPPGPKLFIPTRDDALKALVKDLEYAREYNAKYIREINELKDKNKHWWD